MNHFARDAMLAQMTFDRVVRTGQTTWKPAGGGRYFMKCPACGKAGMVHGFELVCSNPACPGVAFTVPEFLTWQLPQAEKRKASVRLVSHVFPDLLTTGDAAATLGLLLETLALRRKIITTLATTRARIQPDELNPSLLRMVDKVSTWCDSRTAWAGYAFVLTAAELRVVVNASAALASITNEATVEADLSKLDSSIVIPAWRSFSVPALLSVITREEAAGENELRMEEGHAWEGLWTSAPVFDKAFLSYTRQQALTACRLFHEGAIDAAAVCWRSFGDDPTVRPSVAPGDCVFTARPQANSEWRQVFDAERHAFVTFADRGATVSVRDVLHAHVQDLSLGEEGKSRVAAFILETQPAASTLAGIRDLLEDLDLGYALVGGQDRSSVPLTTGEVANCGPSGVVVVRKGKTVAIANYGLDVVGPVRFNDGSSGQRINIVSEKGTFDMVITSDTCSTPADVLKRAALEMAGREEGFIPMVYETSTMKEVVTQRLRSPATLATAPGFALLGFSDDGAYHGPGWTLERGVMTTHSKFLVPAGDPWMTIYRQVPTPETSAGNWPPLASDFAVRMLCYVAGAVARAGHLLESPAFCFSDVGTALVSRLRLLLGQSDYLPGKTWTQHTEAPLRGWPVIANKPPRASQVFPVLAACHNNDRPSAEALSDAFDRAFMLVVTRVASWVASGSAARSAERFRPDEVTTVLSVCHQGMEVLAAMGCPWQIASTPYDTLNEMLREIPIAEVPRNFVILFPTQQVRLRKPEGEKGSMLLTEMMDVSRLTVTDGQNIYVPVDDLKPLLTKFYGRPPPLGSSLA